MPTKKIITLPVAFSPEMHRRPVPQTAASPGTYEPQTWLELVGKAKLIAAVLFDRIEKLHRSDSLRLVFTGPPGTGKSTVARLIAQRLAGHPTEIERLSGKNVNVERVNGWIESAGTGRLFGGWSVKVLEEIDKCTPDGMVLLLDYLDLTKRYPGHAVIGTTNVPLTDCFKDKRLHSRFQSYDFEMPGFVEIAGFLNDRFGIPQEKAEEIAMGCSGDVRMACNDAQSWLDVENASALLATLAA